VQPHKKIHYEERSDEVPEKHAHRVIYIATRENTMKLNGSHKFKASSNQVFHAILNPGVLKACIPGCQSIEYLDADHIKANVTTPLPGLKGPYAATIRIAQRQEPSTLVLEVQRRGKGGSINATSHININDEVDGGALLTYNATAELEGPVAIANNPLGESITKNSLGSFFKNLDKAIIS
jgi:carbon monoxide dehydrogenase subunit G